LNAEFADNVLGGFDTIQRPEQDADQFLGVSGLA